MQSIMSTVEPPKEAVDPEDSLVSAEQKDDEREQDAFLKELCKQRDMFIVSDVLKKIFRIRKTDNGEYENDDVMKELKLSGAIKLLRKLQTDNFLSDSKYKVHKECWLALTHSIFSYFSKEVLESLTAESKEEGGIVWSKIMEEANNTGQGAEKMTAPKVDMNEEQ